MQATALIKQFCPTRGTLKPFLVTNSLLKSLREKIALPSSMRPSFSASNLTIIFYTNQLTLKSYAIIFKVLLQSIPVFAEEVVESDLIKENLAIIFIKRVLSDSDFDGIAKDLVFKKQL